MESRKRIRLTPDDEFYLTEDASQIVVRDRREYAALEARHEPRRRP